MGIAAIFGSWSTGLAQFLVVDAASTIVARRKPSLGADLSTVFAQAAPADHQTPDFFRDDRKTADILRTTNTTEVVIALCGPIGSPLHEVAAKIKATLEQTFGYDKCSVIRLSSFISDYATKVGRAIPPSPKTTRVSSLIKMGDEMRIAHGASVLADLAVSEIRVDREANGKDEAGQQYVSRRVCHIIDSIKNQAELDLLREVYREVLYVVGVFSPVTARELQMRQQGFKDSDIHHLMDMDEAGAGDYGQTVGQTFPQSDFFLRMDSDSTMKLQARVDRFLQLILGTKIITPTSEESAMYAAASAASASACLSRQVGAAVTDKDGAVLAVGWNDVPKAFGGLYQTDHEKDPQGVYDMRCWNKGGGKCFNDEEKSLLAESLVESLGDLISPEKKALAMARLQGDRKAKGLIEFSRAIHAEMDAILKALKLGGSRVSGGSIFVTTYPCHGCARHIVAAGISTVYYIEPYKKSLATKLHDDSITENEADIKLVRILPYEGVAPSRYLSIFRMTPNSRKTNGGVISIAPKLAKPRSEKSLQSMPELEAMVFRSLVKKGLVPDPTENLEPTDGPRAA